MVNAKGTQKLEKCLQHLSRTDYTRFEITVVDCLTPDLKNLVERTFPGVKLIHYDHDIGASASHNREHPENTDSKYLAFLDNDSYVTESWLKELVRFMEMNENVGISQAKILMNEDKCLLDHTGIAIDALGTWDTTRGKRADAIETPSEIFASSSAGCIVRREAFVDTGGFDPDYFIYDDDTDFSFRVRLLGYRVVLVPSSIVFHEGGPTRALTGKKLFHSVKNRMYTTIKNYQFRNLWWRFVLQSSLTLLTGLGLFSTGRTSEGKEVLRALRCVLLDFRRIWSKREIVQSRRCIRDSDLFRKGIVRNDIRPTISDILQKWRYLRNKPSLT